MLIQQSLRSASLAEARAAASELRDLVARMPLEGLEERRARVLALMSIARVEHHEDPRAEAAMVAPLHDEARAVLGAKDLHVYLNNLAVAHLRAGDRASVEAFRQVVELTRTTGNPDTLGMALLNQGAAHSAHLEDVEAERCYAEALELAAANGHHARAARLCCNLAQGRLRRGDAAGARVLSEEAVRWLEGRDEPAVRAKVMVTMGGVELREAALEHARRTLLTSLQAMRRAGTTTEVDAHVYLAEIAARTGRPRLAALHMSRADRRARSPQTRETVRRGYALIDELATKDR
jgi:hypothetical protein